MPYRFHAAAPVSWRLTVAIVAWLGFGCPDPAISQAIAPEFQVNSYTTGIQGWPSVSSDPAGNFIVVWHGLGQDGDGMGVFGQRYSSAALPVGGEFRINSYTTNGQDFAKVSAASSGDFVVVWHSGYQDGSFHGVFGQRFASSGTPLGSEFQINTYSTSNQLFPWVASDPAGNFVVVWTSYGQDDPGRIGGGVFGQRYSSSGMAAGAEFRVNSFTTGSQFGASVAAADTGAFVVVWHSPQDGDENGVFGQRFDSSGTPAGPEFAVNTYTRGAQRYGRAAFDAAGNFVVVWHSDGQDGSSFGVFGQRFSSSGSALGSEFRVNSYTTASQTVAAITSDASGNFVVTWNSDGQDGDGAGSFGRRYQASGAPLGGEFSINVYTLSRQLWSSAATLPGGELLVAWHSETQDDVSGVFARRFSCVAGSCPIGACCASSDTCSEASTEADCVGSGGVWQGSGSGCDPDPCLRPCDLALISALSGLRAIKSASDVVLSWDGDPNANGYNVWFVTAKAEAPDADGSGSSSPVCLDARMTECRHGGALPGSGGSINFYNAIGACDGVQALE